ncbi:MAG: SIMPL domain-containing protein [Solirubrobacteraceae bacterium]
MPTDQPQPEPVTASPTVSVQGVAVVRAEPDEAMLWITLSALEASPGTALADIAARSDQLVALLDKLAIPKADRSTTGVTVGEDFDHTPAGRRSLGHRAVAKVRVRFTAPSLIGRLISLASEDLQAHIDGPHWYISPTNPNRLEAAKQAAANARDKAEAYAAGVDAQLGALMGLSEPESGSRRMISSSNKMIRAASGGGEMPIETGEHEIVAAIDATFALHLP